MTTKWCTSAAQGRRGGLMAGALATAVLTSLTLIGSAPAQAADDPPEQESVPTKTYEKNKDVLADLKKWAPVKDEESVMGYPTGLDRDKDGKIKSVSYEDVKRIYPADTAVADAKKAAQAYADNPENPSEARRVATALVEGDPHATNKADNSAAIKNSTTDDKTSRSKDVRLDGRPAEAYCGGRFDSPGLDNPLPAGACAFVGKLDDREGSTYPTRAVTDGIAGGGKIEYKVEGQVTDEKSKTEGWSVGGKLTPKITVTPENGGKGGEIGGEISYTYSYSSTSLHRVANTSGQTVEINVPDDKKGFMEGRGNGAYYLGYIVVRALDADYDEGTSGKSEHMYLIPARVYVQSTETTSPVTWFKRLTS
ncbi:hypothetical protein IPZ61_21980 [Streptomyces sioyaensis]|uniref:hypothetical protein n=1 Tax=Streptomyces sioyaensis TaxID=67364 RepID=UPI001F3419CC|nr:hypothetical protein [Streptomyces sioyaensis]MCF3175973.1 hypothetical protein [Streptomyces sioyaensis]